MDILPLYSIAALVLGGIVGWLVRTARPPRSGSAEVEQELRRQRAAQDAELERLRAEVTRITAELSATRMAHEKEQEHADAAKRSVEELKQELRDLRDSRDQGVNELASLHAQFVALQQTLEECRTESEQRRQVCLELQAEQLRLREANSRYGQQVQYLDERLNQERQQIESMQQKFMQDFEAISNKLLLESSSKFNEQSSERLSKLLEPLKETIGEFRSNLEITRQETAQHSAVLKEQISRIGNEAANLARALKGDVKALGNWGENMLDQLLEKSGLQRDVHYRRQHSERDENGDVRYLDVLVLLPEKRCIIIDSKVALKHYEEAINAPNEAERAEKMSRHVECLRAHFRGLGAKRYQDLHDICSPDFVLMYIPLESAFFAAVTAEPRLFSEALDQNVVMITNSTLLATLRTVAHVWRLADQQKYARQIAERGGRLYDKFKGFIDDLDKIGAALRHGQDAFDNARRKLHTGNGNLISQAQMMKQLGAKAKKELPADLLEQATMHDEEQQTIAADPVEA